MVFYFWSGCNWTNQDPSERERWEWISATRRTRRCDEAPAESSDGPNVPPIIFRCDSPSRLWLQNDSNESWVGEKMRFSNLQCASRCKDFLLSPFPHHVSFHLFPLGVISKNLPPHLRRTLNFLCAVPLSPPHRYGCLLPTMQFCCRWGPMWPGFCCKSMYILHNVSESDVSSQCSSQHFHSSMLSFPACLGAAWKMNDPTQQTNKQKEKPQWDETKTPGQKLNSKPFWLAFL